MKKKKKQELVKCPVCKKEYKGQRAMEMHLSRTQDELHQAYRGPEVEPVVEQNDEPVTPETPAVIEMPELVEPEAQDVSDESSDVEIVELPEDTEVVNVEASTDIIGFKNMDYPNEPIVPNMLSMEIPFARVEEEVSQPIEKEPETKKEVVEDKLVKTYMGPGIIAPTALKKLRTLTSYRIM